MADEEYVKQLEVHIEKLNQVIDKLLVKSNLLYYVVPKEGKTLRIESNQRYFKTLEEVFISFLHIGAYRADDIVRSMTDYNIMEYAGLREILDIYSLDVMTGERKKVWG